MHTYTGLFVDDMYYHYDCDLTSARCSRIDLKTTGDRDMNHLLSGKREREETQKRGRVMKFINFFYSGGDRNPFEVGAGDLSPFG